MTYTTYENRANPHVTIHCDGCNQRRKHGGIHNRNQGRYKNHSTYAAARAYAIETGLPMKDCSFCNPPSCAET